ncbi:MAG: pcaI [Polaromonas sp.]|nr:pcaI [Polaromonas sp.]
MINKIAPSLEEAVGFIQDSSTIMIGGFGTAGIPDQLLEVVVASDARDLTLIANNAGNGDDGIGTLLRLGRVRKMICSFPRQSDSFDFNAAYQEGRIELELVPQGNLAERIRAAGSGIGAFYSPTGVGTLLTQDSEIREINGKTYALQFPLFADLALIKAETGDRWGNLTYRKAARNFGPVMATAARRTVASVRNLVDLGDLDPEAIVTQGIFVNSLIQVDYSTTRPGGFK